MSRDAGTARIKAEVMTMVINEAGFGLQGMCERETACAPDRRFRSEFTFQEQMAS